MLEHMKRYVPRTVKNRVRPALAVFRRFKDLVRNVRAGFSPPELPYLEFHLTDHCNLNCKGCGHFCPVAPPHFADIGQHERDMRRLSRLFRNIRLIRPMGGEPLLHPEVNAFLRTTRKFFPKSQIRLVTNGLLLPQVSASFWETCRTTGTIIDLTVYPPLESRLADLQLLCSKEKVPLLASQAIATFFAHTNPRGDSDQEKAFKICREKLFCPFLQEGRLYACCVPALAHYFNDRFNSHIATSHGINIHSLFLTGRRALASLYKSIPTCRCCSYDFVHFKRARSKCSQEEWDAESQKDAPEVGPALDDDRRDLRL